MSIKRLLKNTTKKFLLAHLRHYHRYPYYEECFQGIDNGWFPIFHYYPVRPIPRYGSAKPIYSSIYSILDENRNLFQARLKEFRQTAPTPADNETTYWEGIADTKWGSYITEIEKRAILEASNLAKKPAIALEIGCEGGRWSKLLSDLGWDIICTDIDHKTLDICKKRIPKAKCIQVSPNDSKLPCDTETIGLLLCVEVSPVIQSEWFIREAFRVLPSGGLVVGVFWNLLSFRGSIVHSTALLRNSFDYYKFSYLTWRREFRKRGFNVVYEEGFCWFPFRRSSNSPLVPLFTQIERYLGLRSFTALSPWIVFIGKKN